MSLVVATLTRHPDVTVLLGVFLVLAAAERGVLRAAAWLVSATAIGWLVEFSSTRCGFPFGMYLYHQGAYPGEAWICGVPLFASLSFAALSYFGFSSARALLVAPDLRPATSLLAAASLVWLDMVMDPVTLLGRYWRLGDLYHYDPPGAHFGVPITNYAGWFVTIVVIVVANQGIDRLLAKPARTFPLPYRSYWALACLLGVHGYILATTIALVLGGRVPAEARIGAILASGTTLSAAYVVFAVQMLRRTRARATAAERSRVG
jgi:putative membrane protein